MGYGVISWEWRLGIRSWVFPGFLAGVMRTPRGWARVRQDTLLGATIVLSLVSLTAMWFGYAWARRASGTPAAIVAAVACSFYFGLVYFAPKALTEVFAAHVMLPGLYLGMYGEKLGERKRLFLAGLLCGTAACLRIQLLPGAGIRARVLLLSALAPANSRCSSRSVAARASFRSGRLDHLVLSLAVVHSLLFGQHGAAVQASSSARPSPGTGTSWLSLSCSALRSCCFFTAPGEARSWPSSAPS